MTLRLLGLGAILCGIVAFGSTAEARAQTARGTPAGFSTRSLTEHSTPRDSAAALGAAAVVMSRRGQVVLLFALVGAGFAVLAVHDECAEIGCMTILSYPYAAVLGFGIGALVGWIITAL